MEIPYVYGKNEEIDFGKHQGKTIAWIMKEDPNYMVWLFENVEGFDYDDT
jgi:broad specificity phosphatase PhoE